MAASLAPADCTPGVVPDGFQVLKEGQASILQRKGTNEVFYNNAQVTNRDLSVSVLRRFLPLRAKELAESGPKGRKQLKQQNRLERKKDRQQSAAAGSGEDLSAADADQAATANDAAPAVPPATPAVAVEDAAGVSAPGAAQGAVGSAQASGDVAAGGDAMVQDGEAEAAAPPTTSTPAADASAEGLAAQASTSAPGAKVLEGLAASGLRSIRYALEVPGIAQIDANDLDKNAVDSIRRNAQFNGPRASGIIRALRSDARLTMLQSPLGYDVVDLDPYGTPVGLLDSAIQCVRDGGLLLVTATDMANLCGSNGISAFTNYGSYPLHRPYCHEMAVRILLACIETNAARYKRYIVPLLSVSVDFYIRVFVRVFTSPGVSKDSPCKLAYVWQSSGCDSFYLQSVGQKRTYGTSVKYQPGLGPAVPQLCPETGSGFLMGGPIWSEPIHDLTFVEGIMQDLQRDSAHLAASARVLGLLRSVSEELTDVPLYYNLHDICKTVKCQPPKGDTFRSALVNAGYRVSGSHANANALKTDAPADVIWDIVRCWVRKHPVSTKEKKGANPYAATLLAKEPQLEADFSRAVGAISKAKALRQPRFVENPAYWGPMSRHNRPPVEKPDQPPGHNRKEASTGKRKRDEDAADDVKAADADTAGEEGHASEAPGDGADQ